MVPFAPTRVALEDGARQVAVILEQQSLLFTVRDLYVVTCFFTASLCPTLQICPLRIT